MRTLAAFGLFFLMLNTKTETAISFLVRETEISIPEVSLNRFNFTKVEEIFSFFLQDFDSPAAAFNENTVINRFDQIDTAGDSWEPKAEITSGGTNENFATGKILPARKLNSRVAFSVKHPEGRKRWKRDWGELDRYLEKERELWREKGRLRGDHLRDREERGRDREGRGRARDERGRIKHRKGLR